jgi:hypothetical protein
LKNKNIKLKKKNLISQENKYQHEKIIWILEVIVFKDIINNSLIKKIDYFFVNKYIIN